MTRFALRACSGRKLRTTLTAIAIVLGVAMVSGTYVLTDSIDQAFDSIFTDVREGSTVVITGKSAFDLSEGSGATATAFDESLLPRVRQVDGVAQAEGGVDSESTTLIDRDDDAIVFGGRAEPRLLDREATLRSTRSRWSTGELAGAERGRHRRGHGRQEGLRDRRHDRRAGRGAGRAPAHLGHRALRVRYLDRRCHARRLRPADGPARCSRRRASSTRSRSRPTAGSRPTELIARHPGRSCRRTRRC